MGNNKRVKIIFIGLVLVLLLAGLACQISISDTEIVPVIETDLPDLNNETATETDLQPLDPYWLNFEELPVDGGILDETHCDPFCVMGLFPFKSNRNDFELLKEKYELDCSTNMTEIWFRCLTDDWELNFSIDYYTDVIDAVSFDPKNMMLGEIIEVYGVPSLIHFEISDIYSSAWPIMLFYEEDMFAVYLHKTYMFSSLADESGYEISAESKIESVHLFSDEYWPIEFYIDTLIPWEGYGIYYTTGKATEEI